MSREEYDQEEGESTVKKAQVTKYDGEGIVEVAELETYECHKFSGERTIAVSRSLLRCNFFAQVVRIRPSFPSELGLVFLPDVWKFRALLKTLHEQKVKVLNSMLWQILAEVLAR